MLEPVLDVGEGLQGLCRGEGVCVGVLDKGGGEGPGRGEGTTDKNMLKAGIKRPLRFFYAVSFPRMFFFNLEGPVLVLKVPPPCCFWPDLRAICWSVGEVGKAQTARYTVWCWMLEKRHGALGCAHLVGVGVGAGGYKNWQGRAQKYKRPVFVQHQPAALTVRHD